MAQKWLPLYEAADRIKELAPWEWMEESDVFGVQDPDSGEIGFVSIMGLLGEHVCVGVYLGVNALHQFWTLTNIPEDIGYKLSYFVDCQASNWLQFTHEKNRTKI
jgi:hypothetical protein